MKLLKRICPIPVRIKCGLPHYKHSVALPEKTEKFVLINLISLGVKEGQN